MNNKNEKQESTNNLKAKLLKNLEETGYPVELKVDNILWEYGWRVEYHNAYYFDEDEQKGREVDIQAYNVAYSKKYGVGVALALICQVKKSLKKPWVILSTEKSGEETGGYGRLHYTVGKINSNLLSFSEIERRSTTDQFTRIGRSYCEGFKSTNAKSVIFEALTTAVKASEYWLKREKEAIEGDKTTSINNEGHFRHVTFVDPVVILDGLLYEAYLDDDAQLRLNEIEHIPISFAYVSGGYSRSRYLVEIVTLNKLPTLLLRKHKWITDIKNTMINKLRKSSQ